MKSIPQPSLFDGAETPAIYGIFHVPSNRVYVGSAVNCKDRWDAHREALRSCRHTNIYLQRTWSKHGEESFVFRILELVPFKEQLLAREQHWIDFYKSSHRHEGFNLSPTAGSCLGYRRNPESLKPLIFQPCLNCKKVFSRAFYANSRLYCSTKCAANFRESKRQKKECPFCKKMFRNSSRTYCSRSCWLKTLEVKERNCPQCTLSYKPKSPNQIFCSPPCLQASQRRRVKKICELCQKEYEVWPSRVNRSHFCSKECRLEEMTRRPIFMRNKSRGAQK